MRSGASAMPPRSRLHCSNRPTRFALASAFTHTTSPFILPILVCILHHLPVRRQLRTLRIRSLPRPRPCQRRPNVHTFPSRRECAAGLLEHPAPACCSILSRQSAPRQARACLLIHLQPLSHTPPTDSKATSASPGRARFASLHFVQSALHSQPRPRAYSPVSSRNHEGNAIAHLLAQREPARLRRRL